MFVSHDKAFVSNYMHVEWFDSQRNFTALRGLLLNSVFRRMNTYHICHLKNFHSITDLSSNGLLTLERLV